MLSYLIDSRLGIKRVLPICCVTYKYLLTQDTKDSIKSFVQAKQDNIEENESRQNYMSVHDAITKKCKDDTNTNPIIFINTNRSTINDILNKLKINNIEHLIKIPENGLNKENFEDFKTLLNEEINKIIIKLQQPKTNTFGSVDLSKMKTPWGSVNLKEGVLTPNGVSIRAGGGRNLKKSKKIKKRNKTRTNKNNKNKSKRYWY
jgi:hypothetical protein